MRISAVIVHYRTPRLLEAAVAALHEDARASSLALEVIVVDNGAAEAAAAGDSVPAGAPTEEKEATREARQQDAPGGWSAPADVPARVFRPPRNLGYAAGLNLGVEQATGDVLLLMNADVAVEPGCLRALLDALDSADIAGPRLFWDEGCRLMLPPQALRTRWAELDAALAERWPAWGRSFRRRWRRRARGFWCARAPVTCYELTGACLAVTRDGWRRVGRLDEGYRLYFEETEWLLRARRAGVLAVLAPAARCVHAYDQSAQREPRAQLWFEESQERFRRRRYGTLFAGLLRRLERKPRRFDEVMPLAAAPVVEDAGGRSRGRDRPGLGSPSAGPGGEEIWVEVTPLPLGAPATGCPVTAVEAATFAIPDDVLSGARSDLWVRVTDRTCRDLGGWLVKVE